MRISALGSFSLVVAAIAVLPTIAIAAPPAAFNTARHGSGEASGFAYYNTPNRGHTVVSGKDVTRLAQVSVSLTKPSDVLVQFTSQLSTVSNTGCPCSVRASLATDGGEPVVVKRINLSNGIGDAAAHVPDRQPLDGSFVFALPAGRHEISLSVQQVDGSADELQSFYANLQAIVFPS